MVSGDIQGNSERSHPHFVVVCTAPTVPPAAEVGSFFGYCSTGLRTDPSGTCFTVEKMNKLQVLMFTCSCEVAMTFSADEIKLQSKELVRWITSHPCKETMEYI